MEEGIYEHHERLTEHFDMDPTVAALLIIAEQLFFIRCLMDKSYSWRNEDEE